MGLFSKLKNAVTGGGAEVAVQVGPVHIGSQCTLSVSARIQDNAVDISRVYVQIRGVEKVTARKVKISEKIGDEIRETSRDIHQEETVFSTEIVLSGPATLKAGERCEWQGGFVLPAGSLPSVQGRNFAYEWQVLAGLDTRGNDPDSGWQTISVSA